MRGRARFIVLILLLSTLPLRAADSDREPELTVDETGSGGTLVLNLHNPLPFPITVTVQARKLVNLEPSRAFPITASVESQRRTEIARLTPLDRAKRTWIDSSFVYRTGRAGAKHDDRSIYTLPFEAGYAFRVDQGYNGRYSHQGLHAIDFGMPEGTPICAARDGRVVSVTNSFAEGGTADRFKDKANEFSILHDDGTIARYAHMRKDGINLRVGDYVRAGYPIGFSGNTGYSSGPHLHFDVIRIIDGEKTETVPVKFATADDAVPVTLEYGRVYMRPYWDQALGERREPKNAATLAASGARIDRTKLIPRWALAFVGVAVVFRVGRRLAKLA